MPLSGSMARSSTLSEYSSRVSSAGNRRTEPMRRPRGGVRVVVGSGEDWRRPVEIGRLQRHPHRYRCRRARRDGAVRRRARRDHIAGNRPRHRAPPPDPAWRAAVRRVGSTRRPCPAGVYRAERPGRRSAGTCRRRYRPARARPARRRRPDRRSRPAAAGRQGEALGLSPVPGAPFGASAAGRGGHYAVNKPMKFMVNRRLSLPPRRPV